MREDAHFPFECALVVFVEPAGGDGRKQNEQWPSDGLL